MKTIKVTDLMYEALMNISKELNSQDHRSTRMPYIFQVQTQELTLVPEGYGTEAWAYDNDIIKTKSEIEDAVNQYKEWDEHTTRFNHLEDYEIEEILENAGYHKVNYEYQFKLENAFLTSKACNQYIKENKHNLNQPANYLSHAYRNPELEIIMRFLCELTGGK